MAGGVPQEGTGSREPKEHAGRAGVGEGRRTGGRGDWTDGPGGRLCAGATPAGGRAGGPGGAGPCGTGLADNRRPIGIGSSVRSGSLGPSVRQSVAVQLRRRPTHAPCIRRCTGGPPRTSLTRPYSPAKVRKGLSQRRPTPS